MGILDFWRDPRAVEGPALPEGLGAGDAPFCSDLDALAELASSSLRNWSLFILIRNSLLYGHKGKPPTQTKMKGWSAVATSVLTLELGKG